MSKLKVGFTGIKRCQDGEIYRFKKDIAKVPGMRLNGKRVTVTYGAFAATKLATGSKS